jgi:hypothetical protein
MQVRSKNEFFNKNYWSVSNDHFFPINLFVNCAGVCYVPWERNINSPRLQTGEIDKCKLLSPIGAAHFCPYGAFSNGVLPYPPSEAGGY